MIFSLKRIYKMDIDDLEIEGLACKFDIDSGFNNQVKKGIFFVYNLSDDSYNRIEEGSLITFSFIDDNQGFPVLFQGRVSNKDQKPTGDGSIETRILCWSGGVLYQSKRLSISFEVGSTGDQVLARLTEELKPFSIVLSDEAQSAVSDLKYPNGLTLSGRIPDVMREFSQDINQKFTLDNNDLLIGERKADKHFISAKLGNMIGSPSVTIEGTDVECDLLHGARVGDLVDIESKYFSYASSEAAIVDQRDRAGSGQYTIQNYNHVGGTHEKPLKTKLTLLVDR